MKIATKAYMSHFVYEFEGKYFLQLKGGPTGGPATSILSDVLMEIKLEDLEEIFNNSKETYSTVLIDLSNFLDDDRPTVSTFKKGTKFDPDSRRFIEDEEKKMRDIDEGLSGKEITSRELLKALNSLSENLEFTVEKDDDFESGWLPTLDFEMKFCTESNKILYRYYQKPMKTK